MSPTTTDTLLFPKQVIIMFKDSMDQGYRLTVHWVWSALMTFLGEHWVLTILCLFILFSIATFRAVLGRWGSLGSLLYNFFYFGILFVIGLLRGPEVFLSDYFELFTAIILYPVCYWLVGKILDKMGIK